MRLDLDLPNENGPARLAEVPLAIVLFKRARVLAAFLEAGLHRNILFYS